MCIRDSPLDPRSRRQIRNQREKWSGMHPSGASGTTSRPLLGPRSSRCEGLRQFFESAGQIAD
eukprot:9614099-Alexandrium_andersonii.AAC.1